MNVQSPPKVCQAGQRMPMRTLNARPPIHVWMPNQPQATTERNRDGTWAPTVPNDERAYTGKGIP
jgi:hypothetical protein